MIIPPKPLSSSPPIVQASKHTNSVNIISNKNKIKIATIVITSVLSAITDQTYHAKTNTTIVAAEEDVISAITNNAMQKYPAIKYYWENKKISLAIILITILILLVIAANQISVFLLTSISIMLAYGYLNIHRTEKVATLSSDSLFDFNLRFFKVIGLILFVSIIALVLIYILSFISLFLYTLIIGITILGIIYSLYRS